jgi:hypothetical protein
MKQYVVSAGIIMLVVVMLIACGGGALTPEQILANSAEAMKQVDTVQWSIAREGPPIQLDPTMGLSALSAEGAYQAPDQVYAVVKVQAGGMIAEAELVWTAEGVFFKLPPLRPSFGPIDLPATFNPADIFSEEVGIPYVLTNVLTNPSLAGEEDIDGTRTYHITAQAEGQDLSGLVGGAVAQGTATVDLWINKSTSQIVRAIVMESDGSSWTLDLFGYGEPVEIPVPQ